MFTDLTNVNQHCLDSIVKLSEKKSVLAAEDIYDASGMKLWAKGAAVSADLQEKLLRRRLAKPLESTLTVEEGVCLNDVAAEAERILAENACVSALGASRGLRVLQQTAHVALPPAMTLLLTSARVNGGVFFRHSAMVALLACTFAVRMGMNEDGERVVALGAVLHDIGEMYVNPEYLGSQRTLAPQEWKHVAAHPRIGQMLIEELSRFPRAVAASVGEHHERLNGSGYPRQLDASKTSRAGAVLAAAEAVAGILASAPNNALGRANLALRIVPGEFAVPVINVVASAHRAASKEGNHEPADEASIKAAQGVAAQVEAALTMAGGITSGKPQDDVAKMMDVLSGQLANLAQALRATGVAEAEGLIGEQADPEILLELQTAAREITWRLRDLARTLYLRADLLPGRESLLRQVEPLIAVLTESSGARERQRATA